MANSNETSVSMPTLDFSGFVYTSPDNTLSSSLTDIQEWLLQENSVDISMEVDQLTSTATNGALLTQLDDIGNVSMVSAPNQNGSQDLLGFSWFSGSSSYSLEAEPEAVIVQQVIDTSVDCDDDEFETDHLDAMQARHEAEERLAAPLELPVGFNISFGNDLDNGYTLFKNGSRNSKPLIIHNGTGRCFVINSHGKNTPFSYWVCCNKGTEHVKCSYTLNTHRMDILEEKYVVGNPKDGEPIAFPLIWGEDIWMSKAKAKNGQEHSGNCGEQLGRLHIVQLLTACKSLAVVREYSFWHAMKILQLAKKCQESL